VVAADTSQDHLKGARVLVAEDEPSIVMFLVDYLEMLDVTVVGPAGDVASLDRLLDAGPVDAALLDIKLGGESVYPIADRLAEAGIPFVLTSGYDDEVPARFVDRPRCSKPYRLQTLTRALQDVLGERRSDD